MYKPKEFAQMINVTVQTLRNWEKSGKLIPIKLPGNHRRYTDDHLKSLMK